VSGDLAVHIDFPAEGNRAFVGAGLGLFFIAFVDGLISLVRERLGVVPRDDMEVDSSISRTRVNRDEQQRGALQLQRGGSKLTRGFPSGLRAPQSP